jgi:glycosyltransferase involved in cell wall biosynthesis
LPAGADAARVIYNGIALEQFGKRRPSAFRSGLSLPPDAWLIGAIGNVRPSKDYFTLLHAAAILRARSTRYHLVIVGDTRSEPLYGQLLRLRSELGLEAAVTFAGFHEDVPAVVGALDAFVLSSDREGFSLSTVQAMAAGTPVIATRCGGPEEIVTHGHDGWLVPPRDPAALADGIDQVVRDATLSCALASHARDTARARFSVERMVADYAAVYGELLGTGAVAPG